MNPATRGMEGNASAPVLVLQTFPWVIGADSMSRRRSTVDPWLRPIGPKIRKLFFL